MAAGGWPASDSEPGSLTSPFARHLGGLLIAAAGVLALSRIAPGLDQPVVWLAGGLAIGLVCGLLGGGWLGVFFLVAGLSIGLWFDPNRQAEPGRDTLHALSAVGPAYLAAVTGAIVAYAVALLVLRRLRGSGLIQRPSR